VGGYWHNSRDGENRRQVLQKAILYLRKTEMEQERTEGSKESLDRIDEILSHVRSIDAQMAWIIRTEAEELRKLLVQHFSKRRRAAKVYLAVDAQRTTSELAEYLELHVQAVSNELSELESRGLIELKKWGVYKKSKIDSIIRLSSELRKDPEFKDIR
jgi:predicted Rossmann fold nucleotide-binding protein DprA/Smf involved in DNA uptake